MIAESPGSFYLVNKHTLPKDSSSSRTSYVVPISRSIMTNTQIPDRKDPRGIGSRK